MKMWPGKPSVPRASGDKPVGQAYAANAIAVFPALAGINRVLAWVKLNRLSVPRASGDKPTILIIHGTQLVCSPR